MFIRIKTISGKQYAYEVENTWKKGRAKQKVKRYLGPVVALERQHEQPFAEWVDEDLEHYVDTTPLRTVLKKIVQHALQQYGVTGKPPSYENIVVDVPKGSVYRGKKEVVLAMGEGFFCARTVKQLYTVKPIDETRRGSHLAELFLRAGIPIERELFILLYRKINNI